MATRKPDPVDIEVGQRIKIQRLTAGLSQTELGESIGVTFQQVQKYEKGENRVGAGRLTQIARGLKIPVNTFFEGHDYIEKAAQQGVESPLSLITHPQAFRLLLAYPQARAQHGAAPKMIRHALTRNRDGRASGPRFSICSPRISGVASGLSDIHQTQRGRPCTVMTIPVMSFAARLNNYGETAS